MKKIIALSATIFYAFIQNSIACELCKNNQPKGFENITHGTGPTGTIDYIILWIAVVIVSVTLFLSIKYLLKPNENDPDHIKNIVLNEDF